MPDLGDAAQILAETSARHRLEAREQAVLDYFHGSDALARLHQRLWPDRYVLATIHTISGHEVFKFGTRDEIREAGYQCETEDDHRTMRLARERAAKNGWLTHA